MAVSLFVRTGPEGPWTTLRLCSRIAAQESCIFTVILKNRFFFMHMNGVFECVCATVFYRWIFVAQLRATTVVQFANVGPLTPARDNTTVTKQIFVKGLGGQLEAAHVLCPMYFGLSFS